MDRVELIQSPTPLHRLNRLSDDLGIDLWIKRDDLTGFAGGGNKGRKLEYLFADVLASGAEVVVTCGALQSNFVRQFAAACSVLGLTGAAAVMPAPYEFEPAPHGLRDSGGNVLLDHLFGLDLRIHPDDTWDRLYGFAEALALEYETQGKKVYRIPIGGSSPLGAYAFYQAGQEVGHEFDCIVFSTSSGSTHTGLAHFFRDSKTNLIGIAADPEPELAEQFVDISFGLAPLLNQAPLEFQDFRIEFDYVGEGYGVPDQACMDAIEFMARREGILLDPVYSGKAFAGLLALARASELSGRVLFWHTGGVPALFALK